MRHTPHAHHFLPLSPLTPIKKQSPDLPSSACFSTLTSGAGVAQWAADFILVQVGVRDHQDVGALAQGAVIRSLAPHFLGGQCTTWQGRAGWDITGAGTFAIVILLLSHRPDMQEINYHHCEKNTSTLSSMSTKIISYRYSGNQYQYSQCGK